MWTFINPALDARIDKLLLSRLVKQIRRISIDLFLDVIKETKDYEGSIVCPEIVNYLEELSTHSDSYIKYLKQEL